MKSLRMKGKSVDEAVSAALQVLGGERERARVTVLSEGKPAVLGVIGGEDAEVEVVLLGSLLDDAKDVLQEILNKMMFMAVVEGREAEGRIELEIKGDDMGRIIGKEGATLKALETLVRSILGRIHEERIGLSVDAAGYREKREKALERLAKEAAEEVAMSGQEKVLPYMSASDRRIIHMCLKDDAKITTFSKGEGKERRLVISPR